MENLKIFLISIFFRRPKKSPKELSSQSSRGKSEADDGNQNLCFFLLYGIYFIDFPFTSLHNTYCFCTLYKFLVSFQYHREPLQLSDQVRQRSRFATFTPVLCPVSPPDRLSCSWVMIPLMVPHHIYPNSFSAHLRASCSTSLVHVSLNRRTPM